MPFIRRPLLPKDWPAALALADRSPVSLPHVADWAYRAASWALDAPENASVWLDETEQLRGWAVLQTPFWAIDAIVDPAATSALYRDLLDWATARAQTLRMANAGRPMWFVSIAADCREHRQILEDGGFIDVSEADVDPWSKVLFALPTAQGLAAPSLPAGMMIRSLAVPQEIEAYVALHRAVFQSESMTPAWRERTTQMPGYRNELDLVLVADTGELCGFCIAWQRNLIDSEPIGQIEPLGISEPYRGRRLSQTLIAEAVRRLRAQGVAQVVIETDREREAAMAAYRSMGFTEAHAIRVYRYDVPEVSPERKQQGA